MGAIQALAVQGNHVTIPLDHELTAAHPPLPSNPPAHRHNLLKSTLYDPFRVPRTHSIPAPRDSTSNPMFSMSNHRLACFLSDSGAFVVPVEIYARVRWKWRTTTAAAEKGPKDWDPGEAT